MIVVTTPTGQIGHRVVELLLERDEPLRVIARDPARLAPAAQARAEVIAGSHADPAVLDAALAGADALFLVVPPDSRADSVEEHYLGYAHAARAAAERSGVGHLVAISTMGGGIDGAGQLSAALNMDALLSEAGFAYRAVSAPFFMENLLRDLDGIRAGVLALPSDPDRDLPVIATADLAARAAGLLAERTWSGSERLPTASPDALTPRRIAATIADALGLEVAYRRIPLPEYDETLRAFGLSAAWAEALTAMAAAQDQGFYDPDLERARGAAPTTLRTWCETVLRSALDG